MSDMDKIKRIEQEEVYTRKLRLIATVLLIIATPLPIMAACANHESNYWAAVSTGLKEVTDNSPKR